MKAKPRTCVMKALRSPAWSSLIWLGMSAGVSLLATPIRFTASTITRPVALDVGRVVFAALNKAEFIALVVLLITVRTSGQVRRYLAPVCLLALILFAQALWLLPELGARTDQIIAGVEPPASIAHSAYSVLELTKLFLLFYIGFKSLQDLTLK